MNYIYLIFIALLLSFSTYAEEKFLNYEEVPINILSRIKEGSNHTVKQMHTHGFAAFDYSESSLRILNDLITKEGPHLSDDTKRILPEIWGAYLGEVIIKKLGGKWVKLGDKFAVLVGKSHICFPLEKVHKQLINGEVDSIYGFYLSTVQIANELANK